MSGEAQEIARLWSRVLNRPEVSPHDDFFDLGGDSLTAVRIAVAASLMYGLPEDRQVDVVLALFDASTPYSFSAALAQL